MQITLNIDSANIGGTVEQVFATLNDEERKQLAKDVMLEVLRAPMGAERRQRENEVIAFLIESTKNETGSWKLDTPEKARASYKFDEKMKGWKSSSDRMMEMITSSAIENYKSMVKELVTADPKTQEVMAQVRDQFVAEMPKLMQMTMATYFATQMGSISHAMLNSMDAMSAVQNLGLNLKGQLASQGIHIGG